MLSLFGCISRFLLLFLNSWVDVDTRGSVPSINGYPKTNTVYYRIPQTPSSIDVSRMSSDVSLAFREFIARPLVAASVGVTLCKM